MFADDATFWGVYSPRGELEAVENSEGSAMHSASNLSPHPNQPNRVVCRVTVVCGQVALPDPDQFVIDGILADTKARMNERAADGHRQLGASLLALKAQAADPASPATSL